MKYLLYSLRPKHWVKNLFIFAPLVFGKKLFAFPYNLRAVAAFFLFCFAASVAYLINDLFDLKEDKHHPIKRLRPIASGRVSKKLARIAATILALLSIALSFMLDYGFGWIVIIYLAFNFLYSEFFKKLVIIDVCCLAGFFLLRIIAGSMVVKVEFSYWMILMITLLSLFLGFNKRRQDIRLFKANPRLCRHVLSEYNVYFIDQMISIITSSIVVVYMLYTVDVRTVSLVGTNHLLFTIPFVYYGIFRYLYLVHKLNRYADPTRILFSDKTMRLNILLWIASCILVIYFKL
jgi:4-hydroxybenzoate polyprenyltransferase